MTISYASSERSNPSFASADALSGLPLHSGAEANYLQPSPPAMIPLSQSQIEAWHKVRGQISDVHLLVLSVLTEMGEGCIRTVHDETGIETSTISARMHELKELGLIEPVMLADDKQKRLKTTLRNGATSSGSAWKARDDWREFLKQVQGYPGILL